VRGIDRERGEHREDLVAEVVAHPFALGVVEVGPPHHSTPARFSSGPTSSVKHRDWRSTSSAVRSGDHRELLAQGRAVGAAQREPGLLATLQPGHPDHVELVEVAAKMARNRTRSSSGRARSSARLSTRALKSSQDSSRLR